MSYPYVRNVILLMTHVYATGRSEDLNTELTEYRRTKVTVGNTRAANPAIVASVRGR